MNLPMPVDLQLIESSLKAEPLAEGTGVRQVSLRPLGLIKGCNWVFAVSHALGLTGVEQGF